MSVDDESNRGTQSPGRERLRFLVAGLPELAVAGGFLYCAVSPGAPAALARELNNGLTGQLILVFTFPFISSAFLFERVLERTVVVLVALLFAGVIAGNAGDFWLLVAAVVAFVVTYAGFLAVDLRGMGKEERVILTGARWLVSAAVYPGALAVAPGLVSAFGLESARSPRMFQGFLVFSALGLCDVFNLYPRVAGLWRRVVAPPSAPPTAPP